MSLFAAAKRRVVLLSVLSIAALALFFGLFFGLNYPEVVRQGWPITRCTVLDSHIDQRFCCQKSCGSVCIGAPFGAPTCSSITSQINNQFNPLQCAANPSSCPATSGACSGGYKCCQQCCDSCQTCSQSCSSTSGGSSSCGTKCSSYSCNCRCCSSTSTLSCTYTCPTCYTDVFTVTYKTYGGQTVNATVRADMGKDNGKATRYLDEHRVGSTSKCFYNPKNLSEVLFDIKFTSWKWAITAIFGMVPLLAIACYFAFICCCAPCIACCRGAKGSFGRGRKPGAAIEADTNGEKNDIAPIGRRSSSGSSRRRRHTTELLTPEKKRMDMPVAHREPDDGEKS
ncbi:hypothetical protein BKA62DRAFT_833670 [Auriculariales sp. MPI-PUGE-AT-0066]|nr:hypothetical protein BKA62DRAFT_725210 [Auriculariales sp. MPI-PUGE-AT-0066]KAH7096900.1 hypothetical protein BKA62DRAFT_833670 [Auriculariales sp. MPI-PUGE-AT-0066]